MENLTAQQVVWLAIFAVIIAMLLCTLLAGDEPTPPDLDRSTDEARKLRMAARQKAVRERMRREGIKSLLDGRPGWQRINPMSVAPESKKVVRLKGRA